MIFSFHQDPWGNDPIDMFGHGGGLNRFCFRADSFHYPFCLGRFKKRVFVILSPLGC